MKVIYLDKEFNTVDKETATWMEIYIDDDTVAIAPIPRTLSSSGAT